MQVSQDTTSFRKVFPDVSKGTAYRLSWRQHDLLIQRQRGIAEDLNRKQFSSSNVDAGECFKNNSRFRSNIRL
jgi:hypothetical protein